MKIKLRYYFHKILLNISINSLHVQQTKINSLQKILLGEDVLIIGFQVS